MLVSLDGFGYTAGAPSQIFTAAQIAEARKLFASVQAAQSKLGIAVSKTTDFGGRLVIVLQDGVTGDLDRRDTYLQFYQVGMAELTTLNASLQTKLKSAEADAIAKAQAIAAKAAADLAAKVKAEAEAAAAATKKAADEAAALAAANKKKIMIGAGVAVGAFVLYKIFGKKKA